MLIADIKANGSRIARIEILNRGRSPFSEHEGIMAELPHQCGTFLKASDISVRGEEEG